MPSSKPIRGSEDTLGEREKVHQFIEDTADPRMRGRHDDGVSFAGMGYTRPWNLSGRVRPSLGLSFPRSDLGTPGAAAGLTFDVVRAMRRGDVKLKLISSAVGRTPGYVLRFSGRYVHRSHPAALTLFRLHVESVKSNLGLHVF